MRKSQSNTALLLGGGAILAYLIFKKQSAPVANPQLQPPSPGANMVSQGVNLLKMFFAPSTNSPVSTNAGALINPNAVSVVDPYASQPALTVEPTVPLSTTPMQLQLNGIGHRFPNSPGEKKFNLAMDRGTSDYISADAMPLDGDGLGNIPSAWTGKPLDSMSGAPMGYTEYSWAGKDLGVFSGKNKPMFPFHEISGTALAAMGCVACMTGGKAIGKINWEKYIIPVGVVVGGYVLLKSTNLFQGLTSGVAANNAASAAATKAALDNSISVAKSQGDIQTLTDAELSSYANDIYAQGVQASPGLDKIQRDIISVNTLTDLLKMMQFFGTREANTGSWYSICAFTGLNCTALDMPTFVRQVLDAPHLQAVNSYLTAQGINFQF